MIYHIKRKCTSKPKLVRFSLFHVVTRIMVTLIRYYVTLPFKSVTTLSFWFPNEDWDLFSTVCSIGCWSLSSITENEILKIQWGEQLFFHYHQSSFTSCYHTIFSLTPRHNFTWRFSISGEIGISDSTPCSLTHPSTHADTSPTESGKKLIFVL